MAARTPGEWQPARLHAYHDLTPDIRLFEIMPEGRFVPPEPGSHLDLTLHIAGRPEVRSYSVVGPCAERVYRIAVKRLAASRGGSAYMWSLAEGARLTIAPPANHFPLVRGRPDYLLIAGGIGITPIYGMALALAETGASVRMLYACRRRVDAAFGEELAARLGSRFDLLVSEEGRRVDFSRAIASLHPEGELYVCGPLGMMEAAKRVWATSGRKPELLRFETFGAGGHLPAEPFLVRVPRLGKEIEVPVGTTMLDALEAAGVEVIADCRRGECGLCALPILSVDGMVDHRDVFFSEDEKTQNAKLCTCVSRIAGLGGPGIVTIDTADRDS